MSYITTSAPIENSGMSYAPGMLEQIAYFSKAQQQEPVKQYVPRFVMMQEMTHEKEYVSQNALLNHLYQKTEAVMYRSASGNRILQEYAFIPDNFLKPGRAAQPFIGNTAEIEEAVKEAFTATTENLFPTDIRITIRESEDFRKHAPNPGVVGFSINRKENGLVSEIVVLAESKDRVLLTIGHEIGHVLTHTLKNKHDEEAKAFAFTRAWVAAIHKHDIAGLASTVMSDNPAHNGLHDIASSFVARMMHVGKDALGLYWELVNRRIEVDNAI